jgi:DUF4097 and DUF4098 domain-containing protein YvlB
LQIVGSDLPADRIRIEKLMRITVQVISAAGLTLLLAQAAAAERVERNIDAPGDAIVSIENTAGSVEVRGWSRDEVEVKGDLGRDVEELVVEREGRDVRIAVRAPRGNNRRIGSDLQVRVPQGSSLNVSGVSSDIDIDDVRGDLRLRVVSGDITAQGFAGDIEIETVSGDVDVEGNGQQSDARFNTVSGDIDVQNISGSITVTSVSGDITVVDGTFERAQMNTTSADIVYHAGLAGSGRLDMDTINGDLDVRLRGEVSARFDIETFNGEIRNCFGPEPVRTSQYTPGRELVFTEGGGASRVTIRTLNGDLRLCTD